MLYQKSFNITEQNVFLRIKNSLVVKGFKIINENNNSLQAERGSRFAQLYAFDIRKYKTVLNIEIDSLNNLTFKYDIKMGTAIPTPGDQQKLDQELQEILGGVSASEKLQLAKLDLSDNHLVAYTQYGAWVLVAMALVSFVVIPGMGFAVVVFGTVCLIASISNHLSKKIIFSYLLAVILGLISYFLNSIIKY